MSDNWHISPHDETRSETERAKTLAVDDVLAQSLPQTNCIIYNSPTRGDVHYFGPHSNPVCVCGGYRRKQLKERE